MPSQATRLSNLRDWAGEAPGPRSCPFWMFVRACRVRTVKYVSPHAFLLDKVAQGAVGHLNCDRLLTRATHDMNRGEYDDNSSAQ